MTQLEICIGSSCHLKGSYNLIQTFQQLIEEHGLHESVEMKAQFCMKRCQQGVSVSLDGTAYGVSPETAREFFKAHILQKA